MVDGIPPAFRRAFLTMEADSDDEWKLPARKVKFEQLLKLIEEEAPLRLRDEIKRRFSNRTAIYNWLSSRVYGSETGREILLDESHTLDERFEILYLDLVTTP